MKFQKQKVPEFFKWYFNKHPKILDQTEGWLLMLCYHQRERN